MLRVAIDQIRRGMVLARAVPNPKKPEHTLLKGGFKFDDDSIESVRKQHVPYVWIRYPGLGFLDELIDPEVVNAKQEIYACLKGNFTEAQELALGKVNYGEYTDRMAALFNRLLNNNSPASVYIADLQGEGEDILMHGTVVATIAMLMAINLETHLIRERPHVPPHLATDATLLGVGALLHDIGKLQLPENLKSFHLTAQDMGVSQWQAHTEVGFEMIKAGLDATAGQIVLNHHQHFDGSGFPARKRLPGKEAITETLQQGDIHVFCRIAAIPDRFEGLRYLPDGTYAPAIVGLRRLRNPGYAKWFDPIAYEAFFKTVYPFSPGDQVTLNDGSEMVVTEVNDKQPCRPTVRPVDLDLAAEAPEGEPTSEAGPNPAEDPNPEATPPETDDEATEHETDEDEHADEGDIDLSLRPDLHISKVGGFNVEPYLY